MTAKKKNKELKFFPGDKVIFTGPWVYEGEEQPNDSGMFSQGREYEVIDHSQYQDQWDRKEYAHVLLRSNSNHERWVDQRCLEGVGPTEEEVQAALDSIMKTQTSRRSTQ